MVGATDTALSAFKPERMGDPQLEFGGYNWRGLDDLQANVRFGVKRPSRALSVTSANDPKRVLVA
jgi:hypothetical protein